MRGLCDGYGLVRGQKQLGLDRNGHSFSVIHKDLPRLVKQRYGTELRSRTLASIKPEISQALTSLLEEIRNSEDARAMRSTASSFHPFKTPTSSRKFIDNTEILSSVQTGQPQ
jgi:hypothetical protein